MDLMKVWRNNVTQVSFIFMYKDNILYIVYWKYGVPRWKYPFADKDTDNFNRIYIDNANRYRVPASCIPSAMFLANYWSEREAQIVIDLSKTTF